MLDATEDEATFCRRFNLSQHLLTMTSNISRCSYEPRAMVLAMMRSDVRLLELNGTAGITKRYFYSYCLKQILVFSQKDANTYPLAE